MGNGNSALCGSASDVLLVPTQVEPVGNEEDVDPSTGLSNKEKNAIRESWAILAQDMKATGSLFFLSIFESHPEYQGRFPRLRGLSHENLVKSPRLAAHGMTFMRSMQNMINNLDDVELLQELLEGIGRRHRMMGFTRIDFEVLLVRVFEVYYKLLESLEVMDRLSHNKTEIIAAWRHVGTVIVSVVGSVLESKPDT